MMLSRRRGTNGEGCYASAQERNTRRRDEGETGLRDLGTASLLRSLSCATPGGGGGGEEAR